MNKIGFACKYMHDDRDLKTSSIKEIESQYNTKVTTISFLRTQTTQQVYDKIYTIIEHNLKSQLKLLEYVNSLPETLRMVRISSDLLPVYTHDDYMNLYKDTDIANLVQKGFSDIGEYARKHNIRLSMHPDQFCVLASDKEHVIENSIRMFEYHADMIRFMNFGLKFQDFKCNIHIAGALGVPKMIESINRLSTTAKNVITIENEEKTYGLDDCLKLKEHCPIVLDIHHFWINSGYYIDRHDPRVQEVIDSWKGVRPTMHYSQSKEILMDLGFSAEEPLNIESIVESKKFNKKDLCAHSDRMWNKPCNVYAKQFIDEFDIMFEAKHKNLAAIEFYNNYLK